MPTNSSHEYTKSCQKQNVSDWIFELIWKFETGKFLDWCILGCGYVAFKHFFVYFHLCEQKLTGRVDKLTWRWQIIWIFSFSLAHTHTHELRQKKHNENKRNDKLTIAHLRRFDVFFLSSTCITKKRSPIFKNTLSPTASAKVQKHKLMKNESELLKILQWQSL